MAAALIAGTIAIGAATAIAPQVIHGTIKNRR